MNRAYSIIEIKAVDDGEWTIEGVASTPTPDRYKDIVEPLGAKFSLPMPLLWQHQASKPVGEVTFAKPTKTGIPFRAKIRKAAEFTSDALRERALEAWESVKTGLVRGVSIGFKELESAFMDNGGIRFTEWEWLELSLVTIPANAEASITAIKSIDAVLRSSDGSAAPPAASGNRVVRFSSPGASGTPTRKATPKKGTPMPMTITERIGALEAKRSANVARLNEIVEAAEGRTKEEDEQQEFDELRSEIKSVDNELRDLRDMEKINASEAKPVDPTPTTKAASETRGQPVVNITTKPNRDKGIGMARYVMALVKAKGNRFEAAQYAGRMWGDGAEDVVAALRQDSLMQTKAAVAAGDTTTSTWAAELVAPGNLVGEFIEMLRPMTLLGRIPGLRQVPFNRPVPGQSGGGTYNWVGEGAPKPITKPAYFSKTVPYTKAAGIIVLTEELVRFSSPAAEALVRDEMLSGIQAFADAQLVDASVAAVSGVNPASITNGVAGTGASGTTEADAVSDLSTLIQAFATNNYSLAGLVLLTSEAVGFALGGLRNALGEPTFPGVGVGGGTLRGIPLITSNSVGAQIIAVHAPSVLYADDGGIEFDISREASVQMSTTPTSVATSLTSLWQMNLVGLRAEWFVGWLKARTDAVDRITTVAYAA